MRSALLKAVKQYAWAGIRYNHRNVSRTIPKDKSSTTITNKYSMRSLSRIVTIDGIKNQTNYNKWKKGSLRGRFLKYISPDTNDQEALKTIF